MIDTVSLTKDEFAAFAPVRIIVGTSWKLPRAVAARLIRALSPNSDQSTMPHPEEVQVAELTAQVESVDAGVARIRLSGRWAARHLYDGKPSYAWAVGEGIALYDLERKSLRSLLLTLSGAYRMAPPWDKEDRPTGAVVEWRAASL